MADTEGALQPYSRGQRSSVRAVYGVLKKRLPIPHLGWAASDICPNARVSSQPVLCKITRVSATMLTYLGAICKPNRMHLKWKEMPKMKHEWWSPGLACTWPLCGLSARPPPLSGAFGKPKPIKDMLSHIILLAFLSIAAPDLGAQPQTARAQAWQKVPDLSEREQL